MALSEDLYREVILDHSQNPRFRGLLPDATVVSEGVNPMCGDELRLSIRHENGKIAGVGIESKGCSISQASASMLAEAIHGMSMEEANEFIERVKAMLKGEQHEPIDEDEDLAALEGVRKYPVRIKCALLAWNTLQEALESARRQMAESKG